MTKREPGGAETLISDGPDTGASGLARPSGWLLLFVLALLMLIAAVGLQVVAAYRMLGR